MIRLICFFLFSLPLAAQVASRDIAVLFARKPAPARSGLQMGVLLTGGADVQSVASIGPGTGSIVRGANTGASTDDPTVSLLGWTLDSGDRVSGLPAKGSAWTTTNCSEAECYTITSGGQEYINGVARRNLLRWSEEFSNVIWQKANITVAAEAILETAVTGYHSIYQTITIPGGSAYSWTAEVKPNGRDWVNFYMFNGSVNTGRWVNVSTCEQGAAYVGTLIPILTQLSDGYCRISLTTTTSNGSAEGKLWIATGDSATTHAGDITKGIYIRNAQLNLGSTALPYQKTTDSREWALETVGNYVGVLTGWGRWNRVLGPGEVYQNYMRYWKPRINAAGGTLP